MLIRLLALTGLLLPAACSTSHLPGQISHDCRQIAAKDPRASKWGALSGLSADADNPQRLYAVHDHYRRKPEIYLLDVSARPAWIVDVIRLQKNGRTPRYDLEGIARRPAGGFWLVSEGKNLLIRTDDQGRVLEEIPLPAEIRRHRRKSGLEGVVVTGTGRDEQVLAVFQRSWNDDPPGLLKIGHYRPWEKRWRFYHYPIDAPKAVGLSAIALLDGNRFVVLERDNRSLYESRIKRLYSFVLPDDDQNGTSSTLLKKRLLLDLLDLVDPLRCGKSGKYEGVARSPDGRLWLVTDDDGGGTATLLRVHGIGQ